MSCTYHMIMNSSRDECKRVIWMIITILRLQGRRKLLAIYEYINHALDRRLLYHDLHRLTSIFHTLCQISNLIQQFSTPARYNNFTMGPFGESGVNKECDKAAQILKAFTSTVCTPIFPFQPHPTHAVPGSGKIPTQIITNAKGLAIFTCFRAGMAFAGSGGSGVVIARLPDGTWSPPSAFSVRSGVIGLVYGVDVYDCVCVLNTQAAVEAYSKPEMSLGGAVALAAGPLGATGTTYLKDVKPVWTYTHSRGLYGGLTVDGTVVREKKDANAKFYGGTVTTAQILRGEVEARDGWRGGLLVLSSLLRFSGGLRAQVLMQRRSRANTWRLDVMKFNILLNH